VIIVDEKWETLEKSIVSGGMCMFVIKYHTKQGNRASCCFTSNLTPLLKETLRIIHNVSDKKDSYLATSTYKYLGIGISGVM